MAKSVCITDKANDLLDQKSKSMNILKEGLLNSILLLSLNDSEFLQKAKEFNNYFGNIGCANLEKGVVM